MLHAFLAIFARFPVVRIRMNVNGNSWVTTTPFVFVGNNRYTIEGFNLGQRQSLQQGQLSIYFANHTGRSGLLRLALRTLVGQLRQDRDFQALSASEVWINAQSHQLSVALDGEVHRFAPPLHYRVIPRTLQVMLPASLD